jgi:glycosyltransferase involved in cell wall biosynthesis
LSSAPRLSVIVPARNAEATLPATLAGLEAQTLPEPFEVTVVDDGSTDRTPSIARACPAVTRVVDLGGEGPARARNAGAAASSSQYLVFLDADCRPVPTWLSAGLRALQAADLVLGETRPRPDQTHGPFDRTLSVVGRSPLFESANLFVRRELFQRLGGFQPGLGPRDGKELGEDVLFGWRARRLGARIAACPAALVHHAVFPRRAVGFIAERWRLRFFPELARQVPELRQEMFYGGLFLNQRTARFDAAAVGLALAVCTRRPLLAVGALPYLHVLSRDLREPQGLRRAGVRAAADAVGLVAMTLGSARSRSLLL